MMLLTGPELAKKILLNTDTYKGAVLVHYDEGGFSLFFSQKELTELGLDNEGTKLLNEDGVTPEGLEFLSKGL